MDGAASIHFYNSMLSADPGERRAVSPLSVEAYEAYKRQFPPPKKPARPNLTDIKAIGDFLKEQWGNSVGVTKAMNQYLAAMFGVGGDGLATPFAGVPRTSFNRNITGARSEEHTSELQSLMRISYAVFCLKKKATTQHPPKHTKRYNI